MSEEKPAADTQNQNTDIEQAVSADKTEAKKPEPIKRKTESATPTATPAASSSSVKAKSTTPEQKPEGILHEMNRFKVPILLVSLEVIFIILFGVFGTYDDNRSGEGSAELDIKYPLFQDVHVMIFVGFGFLMVFLKKYGYSSVGINFLLGGLVLQWASLIRGFLHMHDGHMIFNVHTMMEADFAAATVLISFGAVLGIASPIQLILMAIIETVIAQGTEWIGFNKLLVVDAGESIFVHAFGAYFGLAVARVIYKHQKDDEKLAGASYNSDLFAMIGSVFLWIYWPSFNGGLATGNGLQRAYINTYFSLTASMVFAFATSCFVDKGKWDMVHVQNSTLAGGVAIGTCASMMVEPWGALFVGGIAGIISVLGYKYLSPWLEKRSFHDTCGVHNLHGMPAVLAALASVVAAGTATCDQYGDQFSGFWGMRVDQNVTNATCVNGVPSNEIRSAGYQAGYQLAALAMTILVAIVTGVLTGFILKLSIFDSNLQHYDDQYIWEMEGEEGDEKKCLKCQEAEGLVDPKTTEVA